jgi:murein DD-endopeptidase MepM/ murein hydrolase activator NlpD
MSKKIIASAVSLIFLFGGMALIINCKSTNGIMSVAKAAEKNETKQRDALLSFAEEFVVLPGQATLVKFPYFGPFKDEQLVCNDKAIPFFVAPNDHVAMAYLAPSYFEASKNFTCQFHFREHGENEIQKLAIGRMVIRPFAYPKENLTVDQKKVVLSAQDQKRVERDQKMLAAIYSKPSDRLLFSEPFTAPLNSKITSIYGTKRVFNNKVASQHLGTDYRAQVGTVIKSSNSGHVVFAGDLFFGGNTVIVDHGLGIFTSYSHLSKISVAVGEKVSKATVLGHSGMTGRVSGPHLHWGAKIHDNWIDGHSLIEASTKNFPDTADSRVGSAR